MESATTEELDQEVTRALHLVIDPELGCNIVDLGLIYDVTTAEGGVVTITMTTTTKGCPATSFLKQGASDAAWAVPGVEFVDLRLTYEPPWTPAMMSPAAKLQLGMSDGDHYG